MKKGVCLLLSIVLTLGFVACSNSNSRSRGNDIIDTDGRNTGSIGGEPASNNAAEAFHYVEKDIGSTSGIKQAGAGCVNAEGQLVIADEDGHGVTGFVLLDRDGKKAGEIPCSLPGDCVQATADTQGNLYVVTSEKDKDYRQSIRIVDPKGTVTGTIDLSKLYGKSGLYVTGIAADADGTIYLTDPTKPVQVLNRNGKLLKTLGSGKYACIARDADGHLVMLDLAGGKNWLEAVDAASGKTLWKKDITADLSSSYSSIDGIRIRYCSGDRRLYLNDGKGILMYTAEGNFAGRALDYGDFTVLAGGRPIVDINIDPQRTLYLTTRSDDGFQLFQYIRQPGEQKKDDRQQTITLSMLISDPLIDAAASKFNVANPGYKLVVKSADEYGNSFDQYKTVLNTEIMAGKGPDIFSVSGLPYEKYIYRNALADLSSFMEKDKNFELNKYYPNILDAVKYKGKLFVLPISFSFNAVLGNAELLKSKPVVIDDEKWTWSDFGSILQQFAQATGKKDGSYSVLPEIAGPELLNMIMEGSYGEFIDLEKKKSDFANPAFTQLLNMAKTYGINGNQKVSGKRYLESLVRGMLVFTPTTISDFSGYSAAKGMHGKSGLSILRFPSDNREGKGAFSSASIYAINAKSSNKEGAYQFLKFLLSDEIQADQNMSGFAVNREVQKKRAEAVNENIRNGKAGSMQIGGPDTDSYAFEPKPITGEEIAKIEHCIEGLGVFSNGQSEIMKIIGDESKAFLSGMKSAEDTARFIQQRVDTYLGE